MNLSLQIVNLAIVRVFNDRNSLVELVVYFIKFFNFLVPISQFIKYFVKIQVLQYFQIFDFSF